MTEDFLHYIWKYRLLIKNEFKSVDEQVIEILSPGFHNTDAGPDFFNARIKINDTLWAGNVEIHFKSSDWYKHKHNNDLKYDNIILHVVYENDVPVKRKNDELITTLCIKNWFNEKLYFTYKDLLNCKMWISCEKNLNCVDSNLINIWKEKLTVDRMQKKSQEIQSVLNFNNNDWSQTFYEFLFKNFGFKINAVAFEMLAKSLPLSYLAKHKNSLFQIEALLFGQAGFLNETLVDAYPKALFKEYNYLKQKFSLQPINYAMWHLLRIRPQNFPQLRIAQLAALIHNSTALFSKVIEAESIDSLFDMFSFSTSCFWETHYLFEKSVPQKNTKIGKASVENVVINTVVPFIFAYATLKNDAVLRDRALFFLESTSAEKNHIISKWSELGIKSKTALDTQALIELKNNYCNSKKCLNCMIGDLILRNS